MDLICVLHLTIAWTPQVAAIPEGAGGTHRLVAWDLLTLGMAWSAALPLAALAAEPAGGGGGGSLVVAVSGGCAHRWTS
jgi:uncharacterized membrane protein